MKKAEVFQDLSQLWIIPFNIPCATGVKIDIYDVCSKENMNPLFHKHIWLMKPKKYLLKTKYKNKISAKHIIHFYTVWNEWSQYWLPSPYYLNMSHHLTFNYLPCEWGKQNKNTTLVLHILKEEQQKQNLWNMFFFNKNTRISPVQKKSIIIQYFTVKLMPDTCCLFYLIIICKIQKN